MATNSSVYEYQSIFQFLFNVYEYFLYTYICMPWTFLMHKESSEKNVESSGTMWVLEPKAGLLQEKQILLTTEPSLKPLYV